MKTHDSRSHTEALNQQGQICQDNLLRVLKDWPVAEYSMRIGFEIRPQADQESIRRVLQESLQWVKAVATYRTLHEVRAAYDIMRRLTIATLEQDYRDTAVDEAKEAFEDALSLLPGISPRTTDAFIIMAMDSNPELDDVCEAIKEACKNFGFRALRAGDIRHCELIANVIKDLITSAQFVIADLTWEKPNVYHEIGIAQGRDKELILVRKRGTKLHSNLAGNNVIEYANCLELKRLIIDYLQVMPRAA